MLWSVGIVGSLALLGLSVVAVWAFVSAARADPTMLVILLATASGAVSMMIANATDPYLQAPGQMWPVYLVLMVVNIVLVGTRHRQKASTENLIAVTL
jgi:hypothetical protein